MATKQELFDSIIYQVDDKIRVMFWFDTLYTRVESGKMTDEDVRTLLLGSDSTKGGAGSGNHGHAGIPGHQGGSTGGAAALTSAQLQAFREFAEKWGDPANINTEIEGLTLEESMAVHLYVTTGYYRPINNHLRHEWDMHETTDTHVKLLDSAFSKMPAHESAAYRGMSVPVSFTDKVTREQYIASNFKVGAEYMDKGFMSTSASEAVAQKFVDYSDYSKTEGILLSIDSKAGRVMKHNSMLMSDEQEVIFPRNSRFIVQSIDTSGSRPIITLTDMKTKRLSTRNSAFLDCLETSEEAWVELLHAETVIAKGGPGSGNHGHSGRPGQRGGSTGGGSASRGARSSVASTYNVTEEQIIRDSYRHTLEDGTVVYIGRGVYYSKGNGESSELMEGKILIGPEEMVGKGAWEETDVYSSIVTQHRALEGGVTGGDFSKTTYTEENNIISHELYMYKRGITTDVTDTKVNALSQAYLADGEVLGKYKVSPVDKMKTDLTRYAKETPDSEFVLSELREFPRRETSMRLRDIDDAQYDSQSYSQAAVNQFKSEVTRTQAAVRGEYGETITLYRGVKGDYAADLKAGIAKDSVVTLNMNHASSWTSDESIARQFAASGAVIQQEIPVDTILFSHLNSPAIKPTSGFGGTLNEYEFVVGIPGGKLKITKEDII